MVATSVRINALDSFGTKSPSKTDSYAAMKAAGGLFGLEKVPLSRFSGCPANDDLHVVVRTDTGQAIGQVGNNYECFPNEEFFGPVAEALVETGATIERFQMLDGGTRAFMRIAWPEDQNICIGKAKVGDIVGRRAIISTSHDGKFAGKFMMQMLRLACSNGMVVPVGSYDWALIHSKGGRQSLIDLAIMIPTIETYVRQFKVVGDILADIHVKSGGKLATTIISKIADPNDKADNRKDGEPNEARVRVNRITELFAGKQPLAENQAVKDTGWGIYQACVDHFTHGSRVRGDRPEQRFKSLLPNGSASNEILRSWKIVIKELGVTKQLEAAVALVN